MRITETKLPGVLLIEPTEFSDSRGIFVESYNRERYREAGIVLDELQDNVSWSKADVVRGLHYQLTQPQGKLVSVVYGTARDIVVDIRRGSPTFGQWLGVTLEGAYYQQLWIPPGFAHGFVALMDNTVFSYKVSGPRVVGDERGIAWNDPDLAIDWKLRRAPILSTKDTAWPRLKDAGLPKG